LRPQKTLSGARQKFRRDDKVATIVVVYSRDTVIMTASLLMAGAVLPCWKELE
jgi:hypothetical protein